MAHEWAEGVFHKKHTVLTSKNTFPPANGTKEQLAHLMFLLIHVKDIMNHGTGLV